MAGLTFMTAAISTAMTRFANFFLLAALLLSVLQPSTGRANPGLTSAMIGTAFAVSAEGHLLTAHHLILGKSQVYVGLAPSGRWTRATVEHVDPRLDLALLRVPLSTTPLPIAVIEAAPVGIDAFVIGYPTPQSGPLDRRITAGLVSGRLTSPKNLDYWVISAAVQKGNSGGPVLAADGSVIGMIQGVMGPTTQADNAAIVEIPQNVNYALQSSDLIRFLKKTNLSFRVNKLNLNLKSTAFSVYRESAGSIFAVVTSPASND